MKTLENSDKDYLVAILNSFGPDSGVTLHAATWGHIHKILRKILEQPAQQEPKGDQLRSLRLFLEGYRTSAACKNNALEGTVAGWIEALEQPAQQQEPFKPDWVNYRQGFADGKAEALEHLKPLTLDQIEQCVPENNTPMRLGEAFIWFARLIEQAHGIKEQS